jgi:hypothetical protein
MNDDISLIVDAAKNWKETMIDTELGSGEPQTQA